MFTKACDRFLVALSFDCDRVASPLPAESLSFADDVVLWKGPSQIAEQRNLPTAMKDMQLKRKRVREGDDYPVCNPSHPPSGWL